MDREKVAKDNAIHGLQSAIEISGALVHLRKEHAIAILELLKEQEAVEPIPYHRSDGTIFKYECRQCRTKIFKNDLFCRHCGRLVKWN